MILRLLSSAFLFTLLSTSNLFSQNFEIGGSVHYGISSLKGNDPVFSLGSVPAGDQSFYNEYYSDYRIEFNNETHSIKSIPGFKLFVRSRFPDNGLILGLSFEVHRFSDVYTGMSNFSNTFYEKKYGTYQEYNAANGGAITNGEYSQFIEGQRKINDRDYTYSHDLNFKQGFIQVGYRFFSYKSVRPFVYYNLGIGVGGELENVSNIDFQTGRDDLKYTYSDEIQVGRESSLAGGYYAGVELNNLKLSIGFQRGKEGYKYDGSKWSDVPTRRTFLFELAYRFANSYENEQPKTNFRKFFKRAERLYKRRDANKWSISIGAGIDYNIELGIKNKIGGDIYETINTTNIFKVTSTSIVQTNPNEQKETVTFYYASAFTYGLLASPKSSNRIEVRIARIFKSLDVGLNIGFGKMAYRLPYEWSFYEASRNINNGVPDSYTFVNSNSSIIEEGYSDMNVNFNVLTIEGRLKIKPGAMLDLKNQNWFLTIGYQFNRFKGDGVFKSGVAENDHTFTQDLNNIYAGNEVNESNTYIQLDSESFYGDDEQTNELLLNYKNDYVTMSEYQDKLAPKTIKNKGITLGVGYKINRLDIELGVAFANRDAENVLFSKTRRSYLTLTYALFGK